MKQSKITFKQNKKTNEESSEVNMVEHKQYSLSELDNMSKEEKIKALVDELNAMSEDIYEKNGNFFIKLDNPYHFYFEKEFGCDVYRIKRNSYDDDELKYVVRFQDAQNQVLSGFGKISEQQQRLIMKFFLKIDEGKWYE